jgi:hypothetical protein
MIYEIKYYTTGEVIYSTEAESLREAVEKAVRSNVSLQGADLRGADLRGADLREANLRRADLRSANLRGAYLQGAHLQYADLRSANLRGAYLQGAHLQYADLQGAYLRGADLRGANLDFSCLPLWCGSVGAHVDPRLIRQLATHICRLVCDEPEGQAIQQLLWPFRNAFCRDRSDVKELEE